MSKNITQDMAYRQSLMKYAQKYGVSRASRKYNKGRSYIYFWLARWDGSAESLACQSRRPHSHPNQHTPEELKLIRDMRRRNPKLGIRHKLIRSHTPRHNGKVERSHREDQKRFYSCHSFYSLRDFDKQLQVHSRRSNNIPMRPLNWLSPLEFSVQYV